METVRWSYSEAKKHSHNVIDSKLERARKVARAAGIDSNMCFLMAHNALVALHYGKPWAKVDYSLIRKVLWIEKHLYDSSRVLERYCRKRDAEDRFWITRDQGRFA